MRTLACRTYWTALAGRPGPVHLNFPLREPLVLDEPLPEDPTARDGDRPYVTFESPARRAPLGGGGHPAGRIVIVAGTGAVQTRRAADLAGLAARSGIPLLADPASALRRGGAAIAHYDLLLRDPAFAAAHKPEFVLRLGDLPTSKPLRTWLAGLGDIAQIAFDPDGAWHDPGVAVGMRIAAPVSALLDGLAAPARLQGAAGWLQSWRTADERAAAAIDTVLGDAVSEPAIARELGRRLPPEATLFVASSMPIRDVEEFTAVRDDPPRTLANRGANGIDGTVSAAYGAAAAGDGPVVLLIGDVALAHDIGGLLAGPRLGIPLTIVLINNDGGGIFHFLPVAGQTDAFEEHVATPHGLDFARAAALYGCGYERPQTVGAMREAVQRAVSENARTTIIEVRTDREANLELHRRVAAAVLAG
jgi:2-succinyl-5-enolpyruvyl-6-hydroxy-3-cyclohexene-1-carboxylate synthase